ncbi:alpha-galactosidase [Fulvivirga sp. M361]|uniref:alpha-galactosidase n=1 Tax=Fulvivirga sp. M361 TaxID=2594266 RepID=UPI00117B4375|nr:alpha-galactosidase [Fulvivirga sp. M361]TRX60668.1 alpha-galactosidase [Fulvivirga sp. M361]
MSIRNPHMFKIISTSLFLSLSPLSALFCQDTLSKEVNAYLKNDTLYIANRHVAFTYYWNQGNIVPVEAEDKTSGKTLIFPPQDIGGLVLPGENQRITHTELTINDQQTFPGEHVHKAITIYFNLGELQVKHLIKLYPEAPAISHTYFLKGSAAANQWTSVQTNRLNMIERKDVEGERGPERIGFIPLAQNHWKVKVAAFKEATDHHDNLVSESILLPYRKEQLRGNVLIASHPQQSIGFFIIKESPIDHSQQYYNGYDFQVDKKGISIHGIGISPKDLSDEWVRGYGYALGLAGTGKSSMHRALLTYQKQLRRYIPERDGMILANTWGDRSKDSRMNESFILDEITQAAKLGITHLQLDDGWQQGLSRNSASKAGKKWDDWSTEDWQPHTGRFPNGFKKIIDTARKKEISIGLWFNPSKANSYELWERDADILLDYYRRYGIRVFKIDGMDLADKQSEINLRKLFTKVMQATEGKVTFNMDVTAGRRVGYHYFNEFGNIFLENRYTDWGNYYPHRTLRNLWKLSAYVPAERLQIEFLNNARNAKKYAQDDVLVPQRMPLIYTSAVTLCAQPLAWMELSGLSETNTDKLKSQLTAYKSVKDLFHQCVVVPTGTEPSGFSITGFVGFQSNRPVLLLVYKEQTEGVDFKLDIESPLVKSTSITRVAGSIKMSGVNREQKSIQLHSNNSFSYGLFLLSHE